MLPYKKVYFVLLTAYNPKLGSRDNISAVVVRLPGAPEPTASGGVMGRRAEREKNLPSDRR